MKKNVLSIVSLCIIFIMGCDRKAPNTAHTSTSNNQYNLMSDSLSIGEIHNQGIERYWNEMGDTALGVGGLNYDKVRSMAAVFSSFLVSDSLVSPETADSITDKVMEGMVTMGFFDSNDSLKQPEVIDSLMIAYISNPSIKTAFTNMYNFDNSGGGLVSYGLAELAKLTSLSPLEQKAIDDAGSVLGSSYRLFSAEELFSNAGMKAVAFADGAAAYAANMLALVYFPGQPVLQAQYVVIMTQNVSLEAAINILNH